MKDEGRTTKISPLTPWTNASEVIHMGLVFRCPVGKSTVHGITFQSMSLRRRQFFVRRTSSFPSPVAIRSPAVYIAGN